MAAILYTRSRHATEAHRARTSVPMECEKVFAENVYGGDEGGHSTIAGGINDLYLSSLHLRNNAALRPYLNDRTLRKARGFRLSVMGSAVAASWMEIVVFTVYGIAMALLFDFVIEENEPLLLAFPFDATVISSAMYAIGLLLSAKLFGAIAKYAAAINAFFSLSDAVGTSWVYICAQVKRFPLSKYVKVVRYGEIDTFLATAGSARGSCASKYYHNDDDGGGTCANTWGAIKNADGAMRRRQKCPPQTHSKLGASFGSRVRSTSGTTADTECARVVHIQMINIVEELQHIWRAIIYTLKWQLRTQVATSRYDLFVDSDVNLAESTVNPKKLPMPAYLQAELMCYDTDYVTGMLKMITNRYGVLTTQGYFENELTTTSTHIDAVGTQVAVVSALQVLGLPRPVSDLLYFALVLVFVVQPWALWITYRYLMLILYVGELVFMFSLYGLSEKIGNPYDRFDSSPYIYHDIGKLSADLARNVDQQADVFIDEILLANAYGPQTDSEYYQDDEPGASALHTLMSSMNTKAKSTRGAGGNANAAQDKSAASMANGNNAGAAKNGGSMQGIGAILSANTNGQNDSSSLFCDNDKPVARHSNAMSIAHLFYTPAETHASVYANNV